MKLKRAHEENPKLLDMKNILPAFNKQPFKFLFPLLERFTGMTWLNKQTEVLCRRYATDLCACVLDVFPYLNIRHHVSMPSENPITTPGGKIIVANHEGFLLDGLFLGWMLNQHRRDIKFIATADISCSPYTKYCFFLDTSLRHSKNPGRNLALYRKVIRWLKEEKVIVIFPGTHAEKKTSWSTEGQFPWSNLPYSLAKKANASIIPIQLNVPESCFFRALRIAELFFYNIKMRRMTKVVELLRGSFCCRQIKYATDKTISCVVGPELKPGMGEAQNNHLRDYVYQLRKEYIL